MANYVPDLMKPNLFKGNFDFSSDTIYMALLTSIAAAGFAQTTAESYTSATAGQVVAGGGYTTDGLSCGAGTVANAGTQPQSTYLSFAGTNSDGSAATANTINWVGSTITAAYGCMYKYVAPGGTTANQYIVAILDFSGSKSSSSGDFKVVFPTVTTGADAILSVT